MVEAAYTCKCHIISITYGWRFCCVDLGSIGRAKDLWLSRLSYSDDCDCVARISSCEDIIGGGFSGTADFFLFIFPDSFEGKMDGHLLLLLLIFRLQWLIITRVATKLPWPLISLPSRYWSVGPSQVLPMGVSAIPHIIWVVTLMWWPVIVFDKWQWVT